MTIAGRRGHPPVTNAPNQLVVFLLDGYRYALPLSIVDRVVRAVEVTPLPDAPAIVHGAINVQGDVIAVLNVRRRFGMPEREISPDDWFLLALTGHRRVALVVDASEGVIERSRQDLIASAEIVPGLDAVPGVIRTADGLVVIHDLEKFLSLDEARALDRAVDRSRTV